MWSRIVLAVTLVVLADAATVVEESNRESKLFPVVQIVTFENGACSASNGDMGSCYSQKECTNLGGTASGTCAKGFGVCCVLTVTCDDVITVNNTYFVNPAYPSSYSTPGMCMVELKPPLGTCQIFIDFISHVIAGPVAGDCNNDTFIVTGANPGSNIPIICGFNTGQHMYIDIDNSNGPYKLVFTIASLAFSRLWKIKVTFLGPNDPCKAPHHCLQYHKETSGSIMSFNHDNTNPMSLNNLDYSICFGYVAGFCDIGYSFNRFDLGNVNANCQNDYLGVGADKLCGDFAGITAQGNATGPIILHVMTDSNNDNIEEGFVGSYMMMAC